MKLNIQALIIRLEEIDMNLGILWGECQNYDLLDGLEAQRVHLRKIIQTLQNLSSRGCGGSAKPQSGSNKDL